MGGRSFRPAGFFVTARVALLRAVNVGGVQVSMADLQRVAEGLGFKGVRTLLQSGNVLFDGGRASGAVVESRFEEATQRLLGLSTDCIVRDGAEWTAVELANPFPQEALDAPGFLHTVFLKGPPRDDGERRLSEAVRGRERTRVVGAHAYVFYPDGSGRSKLTLPVIERALGARGTARNWNTVRRIGVLIGARAPPEKGG